MRRHGAKGMVILGALLATVMAGAGVQAETGGDIRRARPQEDKGMSEMMPPPPEEMLAHMTRQLGLTSDQQAKIKVIFTADQEKCLPLIRKMAEYRQQLRAATQTAKFDEAATRAIAVKQAQVEIELTVSRARVQNQIRTLLTPEQQLRAENLQPPFPGGHGPAPACRGERGFDHAPPPPPPCGGERPQGGGCNDARW